MGVIEKDKCDFCKEIKSVERTYLKPSNYVKSNDLTINNHLYNQGDYFIIIKTCNDCGTPKLKQIKTMETHKDIEVVMIATDKENEDKPTKTSWSREEMEEIHVAVMKQGCLYEGGCWSDEHERLVRLQFNKYAKQNL